MKSDDEAETETRIDFEPTFKCEITGSENKNVTYSEYLLSFYFFKRIKFQFSNSYGNNHYKNAFYIM